MAKQRFSVRAAIAALLREDPSDVERNRRYQPTRTPCPVYVDGNDYLTATGSARKPREAHDPQMGDWRWREFETDGFGAAMGWHYWECVPEGEGL